MKRGLLLILALLILPVVSAEILFTQPGEVYNLGDEFSVDLTLKPNSDTSDFLIVNLVCGAQRALVYQSWFSMDSDEERVVGIDLILSRQLVGEMRGNCLMDAIYGSDNEASHDFIISDNIEIDAELDEQIYAPGSVIRFTGSAVKSNGMPVEGFIELSSSIINSTISKVISGGIFEINFTIPSDVVPGEHTLRIFAYEKNNAGEIINSGNFTKEIRVRQIAKEMVVSVLSETIEPGNEMTFKILLLDQAGGEISDDVEFSVFDANGKAKVNRLSKTGEEIKFPIENAFLPGYWKIEGYYGDLSIRKLFYVEEKESAEFILENSTFLVENTGNVPYKKSLEVKIGEHSKIVRVNIAVGQKKAFVLSAPNSDYEIKVNDGSAETLIGSTALTGNSVNVDEESGSLFSRGNFGILAVILVIVSFVVVAKIFIKRKTSGFVAKTSAGAPSYGKKKDVAVLSLKLKDRVNSETVNRLLSDLKNSGAKIYVDGEHRIVMFDSGEKEIGAVSSAMKIYEKLKRESGNFGIGINVGEVISEKSGEKFTSVSNVVSLAKKISSISEKEPLVSDKIRMRASGKIKFEKSKDYWRVARVVDREKHEGFIKGFLRRYE